MEQIASILHLGGYGLYVWPAYGVAAVVLIGLLWHSRATLRANERTLVGLQASTPRNRAEPAQAARHEAAR